MVVDKRTPIDYYASGVLVFALFFLLARSLGARISSTFQRRRLLLLYNRELFVNYSDW